MNRRRARSSYGCSSGSHYLAEKKKEASVILHGQIPLLSLYANSIAQISNVAAAATTTTAIVANLQNQVAVELVLVATNVLCRACRTWASSATASGGAVCAEVAGIVVAATTFIFES